MENKVVPANESALPEPTLDQKESRLLLSTASVVFLLNAIIQGICWYNVVR